jgi:hypothetical protein
MLINKYFYEFTAKTKKAEHAEMVRLGITCMSYREFLKRKNEGNSPAQMCYALHNRNWVAALARAVSLEEELHRLWVTYEDAEAATHDAYRKIVRRRMPKYPPPSTLKA